MNLEFYKSLKDPIWGDIHITKKEYDIINTDAFNRLRQIKQMSMAYISHIGAQHTRYEHSIGCMHVAYNLATHLKYYEDEMQKLQNELYIQLTVDDLQIIRIAALLHDIGHAPLSHLLESAIEKYPFIIAECKTTRAYNELSDFNKYVIDHYCHELFSVKTIYEDKQIDYILKKASIDKDILVYLISGYEKADKTIAKKFKVYKSIISGDLDADRLDYINRDFYFCGKKNSLDLNTYSNILNFSIDSKNNPGISITEDSFIYASEFLFFRFMLSQTLHNNLDTRINEQAFIELIRDYLLSFDRNQRLDKIVWLHTLAIDSELTSELTSFHNENTLTKYNLKQRPHYSPRDIFNGKTKKDYSLLYKITWKDLHPIFRFYIFYINEHKELISEIEFNMAEKLNSHEFIIDFVTSKPSKMNLLVKEEDRTASLINEFYNTIPHSLMITAYQMSCIQIYSKKEFKKVDKLQENDFSNYVKRNILVDNDFQDDKINLYNWILYYIETAVLKKLKDINNIPNEIYLLLILYHLKKYVIYELEHKSTIWIKGDISFQNYLFEHFKFKFFADATDEYYYNPNIYVTCEKLSCWGLIDHVHKPIFLTVTNKNEDAKKSKYSIRTDRAINQWGEELVTFLIKNVEPIKKESEKIKVEIYKSQNKVKEELKSIIDLYQKRKDNNEYTDDIPQTEKRIKDKHGCIIKFV